MSQWADDSMTPPAISVSRDKYMNEIPSDRTNHANTTPGEGSFQWGGNQYATDFASYGQSVSGSSKAERTSVDVPRADRGKES